VPVTGGDPKRLTFDNAGEFVGLAWSSDGRDIMFSSDRAQTAGLWKIPASGGTRICMSEYLSTRVELPRSFADLHAALSPFLRHGRLGGTRASVSSECNGGFRIITKNLAELRNRTNQNIIRDEGIYPNRSDQIPFRYYFFTIDPLW